MIRTGLLAVPAIDEDASAAVRALLARAVPGLVVVLESAVGMQRAWVAETLRRWCDEEELDLLLTVGGTLPAAGPSSDECVPEATLEVLDRLLPGLPEAMRAEGQGHSVLALLDRGVAGIRSRTLILNLPEGEAAALFLDAVVELLAPIVAHLQGDPTAPRLSTLTPAEDALPTGDSLAEPAAAPRKELDAGEFAAFLKRTKS